MYVCVICVICTYALYALYVRMCYMCEQQVETQNDPPLPFLTFDL